MEAQSFLTEDEFRQEIINTAKSMGSQKALAEKMQITASYLNDVILGKRGITDTIARFFGRRVMKVYPIDGRGDQ